MIYKILFDKKKVQNIHIMPLNFKIKITILMISTMTTIYTY